MPTNLNEELSTTSVFGLKVWELVAILFGVFVLIIMVLSLCLSLRKKSRRTKNLLPLTQIPTDSKEIKEIIIDEASANKFISHEGIIHALNDKYSDKDSEKALALSKNGDTSSQSGSFTNIEKDGIKSQLEGVHGKVTSCQPSSHPITAPSPLSGLPEFSHLGWGHWFTLRELEVATGRFSKENVIGEGGYGVVYSGCLVNGTPVAVKKLLNNLYVGC